MVRSLLLRAKRGTFQRSFVLILIAEILTIVFASLLLNVGINQWLQDKTASLIRISQRAASAVDWSQIDKVPRGDTGSLNRYETALDKLSGQYFVHDEGSVFLAFLKSGEEYDTYYGDQPPLEDAGKANRWVLAAYKTKKMTYSPTPIVDDIGTYLAAYAPIVRNGKVIGLLAAEYDSAPLPDFRSIVATAFWFSVIPAVLISLLVAYILASMFVEPMDVFRTIAVTAENQRDLAVKGEQSDPWAMLTPRQRQVGDLVSEGKSYKEIAEALSVSTETVKQHLKDIKGRTGWGRVELAINAAARSASRAAPATI